jgi:hypothetical protein
VNAVVKDGIVTIAGTPETASVGHDIVSEARQTTKIIQNGFGLLWSRTLLWQVVKGGREDRIRSG